MKIQNRGIRLNVLADLTLVKEYIKKKLTLIRKFQFYSAETGLIIQKYLDIINTPINTDFDYGDELCIPKKERPKRTFYEVHGNMLDKPQNKNSIIKETDKLSMNSLILVNTF